MQYYFIFLYCVLDSSSSSVLIEIGNDDAPNENPDFAVPETGPANSASKITCRVCQEMIDVVGKLDQHVVKCNRCNEATVSVPK